MKLSQYSLLIFLAAAGLARAQSADITEKIRDIDAEISKIKKYQSEGVASAIFAEQLSLLESERQKYIKLQGKEERSAARAKRDASVRPQAGEIKDKKFPTALKKDLENFKHYKDDSIPLERRYDLILEELKNLYAITEKLEALEPAQRGTGAEELMRQNKEKIAELTELKTKYEIRIREAEQADLAEMKRGGVRIGVMFDAYYQWSFNRPKRVGDNAPEIAYRNYDNRHNDFTINLFELNVYKSYKNLDFYADLDFGEQPEQNESVSADPVSHHIGQAFLRYKLAPQNLTFTAGKFYSHFGYEVPKNIENRTYSRPFYFTLICPFWHEGVSMTQTGIGNYFGYGIYVYDKTDDRVDNDSDKTYGLQLNYSREKLSAVYNFISGSEQNDTSGQTDLNQDGNKKTMHELIVTHTTTDWVTLVFDGVIGSWDGYDSATGKDSSWVALVGYADFKLTPSNLLNFRYENFNDLTESGAASTLFRNDPADTGNTVGAPRVDAYTVTHRYSIGNGSEVRLEYRLDRATKEIFANQKGEFQKDQSTVTLGWLYSI